MPQNKTLILSLTGPASHRIIDSGMAVFSLGTIGMDAKKFDALADRNLPINWAAFEDLTRPGSYPWPRYFNYHGDDTGFIKWSHKRPVESFSWHPEKSVAADFTAAKIDRLTLTSPASEIEVTLGEETYHLCLYGEIDKIRIRETAKIPSLEFHPATLKKAAQAYKLPHLSALSDATFLDLTISPTGQAFDCESLLQFRNLTNLRVSGNLANLPTLEKLEKLKSLQISHAPDLAGFPAINCWKHLDSFHAFNIEEPIGVRLRAELKKLSKERDMGIYSGVTQLRKPIWFTTEYGIPFSEWEGKSARTAIREYKLTLKTITVAKTKGEVKTAIMSFVETFNRMPNMDTIEREDVGDAVGQLAGASPFPVDSAEAEKWFDDVREF